MTTENPIGKSMYPFPPKINSQVEYRGRWIRIHDGGQASVSGMMFPDLLSAQKAIDKLFNWQVIRC